MMRSAEEKSVFRRKEPMLTSGKIETVLGPNTSFNGHLQTDGNLRIEGLYEGVIETLGNIIIGQMARVKADIMAHSIQVWGTVAGSINANDRLEILHTGRVFADVVVDTLLIDDGGVFRGKCVIRGAEGDPLAQEMDTAEESSADEAESDEDAAAA